MPTMPMPLMPFIIIDAFLMTPARAPLLF